MKLFASLLAALIMIGAGSAYAAGDEFGKRFGDTAPTALREGTPASAMASKDTAPQNIEPAAGDEDTAPAKGATPVTTPPADPAATDALKAAEPSTPPNATPTSAAEQSQVEKELESKMGADVTSTTQELGDGETKAHDSVGDGKVRAFYKSEKDGRVMDTENAVGVEVQVLKFK